MPRSLNVSGTSNMLDSKMAAQYQSSRGQVILSLTVKVKVFVHFQRQAQQILFYLKQTKQHCLLSLLKISGQGCPRKIRAMKSVINFIPLLFAKRLRCCANPRKLEYRLPLHIMSTSTTNM